MDMDQRAYSFRLIEGANRLGVVNTSKGNTTESPAFLMQTAGGSFPAVPSDLALGLNSGMVHLALNEVLDHVKLDQPSSFFALPPRAVMLLSLESMLQQNLPQSSSGAGLMVETASGRKEVTPAFLLDAVTSLDPDFFVSLSPSSSRHPGKAREKANAWLDEALAAATTSTVLVSVDGDLASRRQAAASVAALAARNVVVGVVVGGLEGLSDTEKRAAVEASLVGLPVGTLRFVLNGFTTPAEIIDAASD